MEVTWADAWQIAGEIVDFMQSEDVFISMAQQEKIADIVYSKKDKKWSSHWQEWINPEGKNE